MKRSLDEDGDEDQGHYHNQSKLTYFCADTQFNNDNIMCNLTPHCDKNPSKFSTYQQFETHYANNHSIICNECNARLPSDHILTLHLVEVHDTFAQARKARGDKIYACFEEQCDKVCAEPGKRRRHLIDKHGYPTDYPFNIIKKGVF